jgi:hypothetical protein
MRLPSPRCFSSGTIVFHRYTIFTRYSGFDLPAVETLVNINAARPFRPWSDQHCISTAYLFSALGITVTNDAIVVFGVWYQLGNQGPSNASGHGHSETGTCECLCSAKHCIAVTGCRGIYIRCPVHHLEESSSAQHFSTSSLFSLFLVLPCAGRFFNQRSFIFSPLQSVFLDKQLLTSINMRYSIAFIAAIASSVQAHGVLTEVQGANGVNMPGLSGKLPFFPRYIFISI